MAPTPYNASIFSGIFDESIVVDTYNYHTGNCNASNSASAQRTTTIDSIFSRYGAIVICRFDLLNVRESIREVKVVYVVYTYDKNVIQGVIVDGQSKHNEQCSIDQYSC